MSINFTTDIMMPFLIGGFLVMGIKLSSKFVNPALAAIIGALPIGYLTMNFVMKREPSKDYAKSYMLVSATTIIATLIYYLIIISSDKFPQTAAWAIGIGIWVLITIIKYFITQKMSKKD